MNDQAWDVVIVGGGPAGLSAALVLGRCRRHVLLCDAGHSRNSVSQGIHCFLSRDGVKPQELRRVGREQLQPYTSVNVRDIEVVDATRRGDCFEVTLSDGSHQRSRRLMLATGVIDRVPEIEGIERFYGHSVYHCPYCDGWEMRDQPIAVYGRGRKGHGLALELTCWSRDVILCTDGPCELTEAQMLQLDRNGIGVIEKRVHRLEGEDTSLKRIVFTDGDVLPRAGMFFSTGNYQRSDLAVRLGCVFSAKGAVDTMKYERTNIPGLYVVGDASHDVQFAIVAAAEGTEAAFDINQSFIQEELR
jgi:thioredoxin reductase